MVSRCIFGAFFRHNKTIRDQRKVSILLTPKLIQCFCKQITRDLHLQTLVNYSATCETQRAGMVLGCTEIGGQFGKAANMQENQATKVCISKAD